MPPKICSKLKERSTRKQTRTHFTDEQIEILERTYKKHQYVLGSKREKLAMILDLPEQTVKFWFKNKRRQTRRINDHVEDNKYSRYMKKSNSKMTKKSERKSDVKKKCFFTREQKEVLENVFQKQTVMNKETRHELALLLGVSEEKVSNWFRYKIKRLGKLGNKEPSVRQDETSILIPQQAACIDNYELPVNHYIINDETLTEYVSGFVDQTFTNESLLTTDCDEESINFPELPIESFISEVQQSRDESWIHQDLTLIDTVNSSWQPKVGVEMCSIETQYYEQGNFTKSEFYSMQENICDYDHFSAFRMLNPGYCWGE